MASFPAQVSDFTKRSKRAQQMIMRTSVQKLTAGVEDDTPKDTGETYIALRDHLETYPDAPFTVYPMQTYTPPTGANGLPSMYWIVQDMRLPVTSRFIGATDPDEYTGSFQVHIMVPEEVTHPQLMYQVGLVANHFPKLLDIWLTDGRLQITGTPYLATEPYQDGIYYRAPVIVTWRLVG